MNSCTGLSFDPPFFSTLSFGRNRHSIDWGGRNWQQWMPKVVAHGGHGLPTDFYALETGMFGELVCVCVCDYIISFAHNRPRVFQLTQHKIQCPACGLRDPFLCFKLIFPSLLSISMSLLFHKHSKPIPAQGLCISTLSVRLSILRVAWLRLFLSRFLLKDNLFQETFPDHLSKIVSPVSSPITLLYFFYST